MTAPVVEVVGVGGPGAGVTARLGTGRHVVGRSRQAAVVVHDDSIELHHVCLDVGDDGTVEVRQLSGRVPGRIDGRPLGSTTRATPILGGDVLVLGASRLRVGRRPPPVDEPPALAVPRRRTGRRLLGRRRDRASFRAELTAFEHAARGHRGGWLDARHADGPTLAGALAAAADIAAAGWPQRPDEDWRVGLGVGVDEWRPLLDTSEADPAALAVLQRLASVGDAPIGTDLGPGAVVTIEGDGALGVAGSLVAQLAVRVGPGDLGLRVDPLARWAAALPHAGWSDDTGRHVVALVDAAAFAGRSAPAIREALALPAHAALVVVGPGVESPGGRLVLGAVGCGRWRPGIDDLAGTAVHPAAIDAAAASALARTLVAAPRPAPLPAVVTWPELVLPPSMSGVDDTIGIAAAWSLGTRDVPLGADGDGVVALDPWAAPLAVLGDDDQAVDDVLTTLTLGHALRNPGEAVETIAAGPPGDGDEAVWAGALVDAVERRWTGVDERPLLVIVGAGGRAFGADAQAALRLALAEHDAAVVVGGRPDDPAVALVVAAGAARLFLRTTAGPPRAARLGAATGWWVPVGGPARALRLATPDADVVAELRRTIGHARSLVGGRA